MRPSGLCPARIMIVGEAPSAEEERLGTPFVGESGRLLDKMLHEAGILRHECFVTNVARARPAGNDFRHFLPGREARFKRDDMIVHRGAVMDKRLVGWLELLDKEIALCQPETIIALGNAALWATTGKQGISKWRGSRLGGGNQPVVIPAFHPAAILRQYELRAITVQDFRRAAEARRADVPPVQHFTIRPSLDEVNRIFSLLEETLAKAPTKLAVDIETRQSHIACIGIAWSRYHAICIPLMDVHKEQGYWSHEEEAAIVFRLCAIMSHPNAQVVGQNFLYDTQYIYRYWRCIPTVVRDTMGAQHAMFAGGPKDLAYLSSMWCDWHVYWKDDSKEWDPKVGEEQLWRYNCVDCVRTFEIDEKQQAAVDKLGLREFHDWHQAKFWIALEMMLTGIRRDETTKKMFADLLIREQFDRMSWITQVLGHSININSPKQLSTLFYEDLKQKPVMNRKTSPPRPTCNSEAMEVIARREPLLRPLCNKIAEYRSLGVFLNTFVLAKASWDGRIRTQFNPFGPETYRASSSQDAFGSGMNLQNVPSGNEDDPNAALVLPNIRRLFLPDPGMVIFDCDLDRADLQVVVWEAEDAALKQALRAGVDLHLFNARDIFHLPYPDDEIIDGTEKCEEHKKRYKKQRSAAKAGVHAANYGVGEYTLAITLGITRHEAGKFLSSWFSAHPGIKEWHKRTEYSLLNQRYVQNRFGARRYYFERLDGVLPEALAWTPQSTVAEVINRLWWKVAVTIPRAEGQILLQVHDSLVGQTPQAFFPTTRNRIYELARTVVVPYDDPLNIPIGFKWSTRSWGDATANGDAK